MDTSSTLEEKAVALYKSKNTDAAIAELRRALADAPGLPDDPQIAVVLRRITAHRTLAAWLAERASKGGMLVTSDQEEGTRLYESALKLLDNVFPENEEEPIEENPDFKPKEQSLADALKMEITRVRFALLLQLVRLHAVTGQEAQDNVEKHGRRLFDSEFIAKAEKMGAAAPTEEFTDARKAWRASLLRIGAEAFTKVGSDEAAQRWRDVLDLCRSRERDVHMQMGIARPTAEMRGQTVEALMGLATALHPPWNQLPTGVVAADGSYDRQRFETALDEIETCLRDALEIIEQVGDAEMVASSTLSSVLLARTLRMPVVSAAGSTAGRGVSFLTNYPARAREFAKLMHDGLLSATSALGEIPAVPAEAFSDGNAVADVQLPGGLNDEEEEFGDQRDWEQLSTEEQSAAQRLGWTAETWDDGEWLDEDGGGNCVSWDALKAASRADAELLGFDQREWDLCYYADEHEEAEDQRKSSTAQQSHSASAEWNALHSVVASTAALTSLPPAHRRAIELAIDCAMEQLLVVAAEIAEEAAERYELQLSRVRLCGLVQSTLFQIAAALVDGSLSFALTRAARSCTEKCWQCSTAATTTTDCSTRKLGCAGGDCLSRHVWLWCPQLHSDTVGAVKHWRPRCRFLRRRRRRLDELMTHCSCTSEWAASGGTAAQQRAGGFSSALNSKLAGCMPGGWTMTVYSKQSTSSGQSLTRC